MDLQIDDFYKDAASGLLKMCIRDRRNTARLLPLVLPLKD